jgi:hypothetical protein
LLYNWIEQTQRAQGRGFFAAFVSELPGSIKKSQGPKSLGLLVAILERRSSLNLVDSQGGVASGNAVGNWRSIHN